MGIETLPQSLTNVPTAYQHLFTLDPQLVKEISKKNIDLIFLEFTAAEGQLRVQNKRLSYEMRTIGHDELVRKVNEKLAEYDRFGSVGLHYLAKNNAGTFSGVGPAAQVISQVATSTGQHFDSQSKGRIDSADHQYQTTSSLNQERTQAMREEDQQFDRALSSVDRAMQAIQKAFDSLNGV